MIECAECSMLLYSQSGQSMQAMRVCKACDKLIHDISYKRCHKRMLIRGGSEVVNVPNRTINLNHLNNQAPKQPSQINYKTDPIEHDKQRQKYGSRNTMPAHT